MLDTMPRAAAGGSAAAESTLLFTEYAVVARRNIDIAKESALLYERSHVVGTGIVGPALGAFEAFIDTPSKENYGAVLKKNDELRTLYFETLRRESKGSRSWGGYDPIDVADESEIRTVLSVTEMARLPFFEDLRVVVRMNRVALQNGTAFVSLMAKRTMKNAEEAGCTPRRTLQ